MAKAGRQLLAVLLCLLVGRPGDAVKVELERNNWAVLVGTSRYWYNYRHVDELSLCQTFFLLQSRLAETKLLDEGEPP